MVSLVSHVGAASSTGNTITTAAINTTGATFIYLALSIQQASSQTVTDSFGNTYIGYSSTNAFGLARVIVYYCANPIVGANHTFTVTTTANYPALAVAAFSGVHGATDRGAALGSSSAVTTQQPGSITPVNAGDLLVTSLCTSSTVLTATVDSGFTVTDFVDHASANYGVALAWLAGGSPAAVNPTWTVGQASGLAATILSFTGSSGISPNGLPIILGE